MTDDPLVAALKAALPDALRARDAEATSALRTALAAIANAEAVADAGTADTGTADAGPADDPTAVGAPAAAQSQHVAGAALGVGAAEVQRRALSREDVRDIVTAEVHERLDAAAGHEGAGQAAYADRLRREAAVLQVALDATAAT